MKTLNLLSLFGILMLAFFSYYTYNIFSIEKASIAEQQRIEWQENERKIQESIDKNYPVRECFVTNGHLGTANYADCLKEKFGEVCWLNMEGEVLEDSEIVCEYDIQGTTLDCIDSLDKVFYYHPVKCNH